MKSTMIRRVLAFMVSMAMVFGLTPSYAFAEPQADETQSRQGAAEVDSAQESGALPAEVPQGTSTALTVNVPTRATNIVEVSSWSEVQSAARNATSGQTIKLMQDCVNSGSDKGRIQVKTSVTIDLNGHKLDRDLSKRYDNGHVIEVFDGATLTIEDETGQNKEITGGYSKDGGGIYINGGAKVILKGGTITGNMAAKEGGGVYVAKDGTLEIEGGAIDGNAALSCGGGIVVYGKLTTTGGAIRSNIAGDAESNLISPIYAEGGGIYVCADGTMTLNNTVIEENIASKNGGGIYIHSKQNGSITECTIARNKTTYYSGGGIYMDADKTTKLTVENSSIENNESADDGGGIYLYWGTIDMIATDGKACSLSRNRAADEGGGAKVTRNTTFIANGVSISNNKAEAKEGGGIKNFGRTELTNCSITYNHAILQGGGIYSDNDGEVDASLSLSECIVSQNSTSSDGGGIYSDAKIHSDDYLYYALKISGGTITGNFAGTGKGNGLCIGSDSDNPRIQDKVIIKDNSKTVSKQEVYLSTDKKLELCASLKAGSEIGVTLQENAGIFTYHYQQYMSQSSIGPNDIFFSPEGLDIESYGDEVRIACYWDNLQRKIDEAANNGTVDIDRDYTYSLTSEYKALTIPQNKHLTIDLHGYTLNRNASTWSDDGCVIVVRKGAELTIVDSGVDSDDEDVSPGTGQITGGWGVHGGGVCVEKDAIFNFKGGIITGNKATDNGGGIYVAGTLKMDQGSVETDGDVQKTYGIIDDNAAGEGGNPAVYHKTFGYSIAEEMDIGVGGGIYVSTDGKIELTEAHITNNKAKRIGGGICTKSKADSTSFTDCTISGNRAGESGGGIYMDANGKSLEIASTCIDGNKSEDDGGGIYLLAGTVTMKNSETQASSISHNIAQNDSGAVKVEEGAILTATGASLCDNKALTKEGGAIKNYGTTKLTNCIVDGNQAKKRGGGIYNGFYADSAEGDLTIEGCTITNNSTEEVGGGIISSRKLTIVGASENLEGILATTISGNTAAEEGGGIYVGSDAGETSIKGEIIIRGNTAERGNDLYLRSGKKLTIAGEIEGTKIGDISMEKPGTFTTGYSLEHPYNPDNTEENHPSTFFCKASWAIPADWAENFTEAQLYSAWPILQQKITDAESSETHIVELDRDYTASSNDTRLKVGAGKTVILDLKGYTINRNLTSVTDNGHVIELFDGAKLTIIDTSPGKTGKIIGGYSKFGGGIYVGDGATLNFCGGTITRNHATQKGGGIYVHSGATVNIESYAEVVSGDGGDEVDGGDGGVISGNKSDRSGGGIYVDGTLKTTSGIVDGNNAGVSKIMDVYESHGSGGGIFVSSEGSINLSGLTVTNNSTVYNGGGICLGSKDNPSISGCTIANNDAAFQGGGIFLDAEGKTLTIEKSHIDGNSASFSGGGFYLRWGMIEMLGTDEVACTLSNNVAANEGGGGVVTSNTNCTATSVKICGNTVAKEGGGGILNAGTTELTTCFISENTAPGQGGGIYNTSEGTLTLQSCSVYENNSESNGGGICSNNKLYLINGEVLDNNASNRGGGIYIDKDAGTTGIEGDLIVRDNTADRYGNDIYLIDGKKLTLTAGLGGNADIGVDLEKGAGTITKDFSKKNPSADPQEYFIVAAGFDLKVKNGEAVIESGWKALKDRIESAPDGDLIELTQSYAAVPGDDRIIIPEGKHITVDLKGYTLNRNKGGKTPLLAILNEIIDPNGHVFEVYGTLTLKDTSDGKTGVVMDGWAKHGGGIYVHGGATLNLAGGTITGNRASEGGGGIYVSGNGTLNMTGGTIEDNATNDNGGGIYVTDNGTLRLSGGTITGNTADKRGGGIYAKSGATIAAQGNPVVRKNSAAATGHDIYLSEHTMLKVSGAFTEGARMGIAIEGDYGVFTSGYGDFNPNKKPSLYFASTQAYEVSKKGNEAVLGPDTFGKTEYEDPFIDWNDQIKTDPDVLTGQNWMSGISGERYLNEINMPGSHDSGMYKIQKLTDIALDYTAGGSYLDYDSGAFYATTQTKYIYQQLEEGARQLDLRLNDWYKAKVGYGYDWDDDGKNLWVCHGTSSFGGTYFAVDDNGNLLSFDKVLEWVKDFLEKHPTETVILNMRAETPISGHGDIIYRLAKEILKKSALQINPATGEPFLYKESGSDDYFAPYTQMPQLKDCRGKIVLLPQTGGFVEVVGGVRGGRTMFEGTDSEIAYTDPTDYTVTSAEQLVRIREADAELNADGPKPLPTDADGQYDFLWYWELNCTGEDQGDLEYYMSKVNPVMHASRVNPGLIGDGKTFGSNKTGEYIGWVRMDAFSAKYAEPIWRTNIFEGSQYCTITVKSDIGDPYEDQTFEVLKGTTIEIPGNIYKDPNKEFLQGKYLSGWQAVGESSGTEWACYVGEQFRIDEDVTFTAKWLNKGEVPVSIVWQDGDNADKLRPSSVELSVPTIGSDATGQATTVTLTSDDGWSAIVMGDAEGIVPIRDDSWFKPNEPGDFGQDAPGEYRCERNLVGGTGLVFTFIHTPQTKVKAAGTIEWDDDGNAAGSRPVSTTLHLRVKGSDADVESIAVIAEEGDTWQYGFGDDSHEFPQYKDGKEIEYVVVADAIEGYSTTVEGFSITNTSMTNPPETVEVKGIVEWDDAQNAEDSRPESITVHLYANDVEDTKTGPLTVTKGEYGLWMFNFGKVPVKDSNEVEITYSVVADRVDGYKDPSVEPLGPYAFRITNTLDVPEDQKKPAEISSVPKPCVPTYNGEARTLIEAGSSPDGIMVYALGESGVGGAVGAGGGDDADAPAIDAFSTELPAATDVGVYAVWYYVKGDAFHKDYGPVRMEAAIDKRPVEFTGVSETKAYTGSEVEIADVAVQGLLEGHEHNVAFSAKGTDVGEHPGEITAADKVAITADGADVTGNYNISVENGSLTIEQDPKLSLEITSFDSATFTYDGQLHALAAATTNAISGETTIEYSKDGKAWTADIASLAATDVADSGTIQVRASNPNYANEALGEAGLSIEPAQATFVGVSETKAYTGSEVEIADVAVQGLLEGHEHNVAFSAKGTDVGEHPGEITAADKVAITADGADVTGNYNISVENGSLTIEQDPKLSLEITSFDSATFTYDGQLHALAAATTNAISGETTIEYSKDGKAWTADIASLAATDVADSGTIQVRASNPNYANEALGEAGLSIEPAKATIKVDDASKVAGEADPAFTGKIEGLASVSDLGEVKYVRVGTDEASGTYKGVITAEYVANPNYEVSVTNGDFTITEAPVEKGVYVFTSGAGGTYTQGSNKELGFKIERTTEPETAFSHFAGIEIDGKAVSEKDASGKANWTAKSGSVVLALQPSYLDGLGKGKHTVSALFDDGDAATVEFAVAEKASPTPTPTPDPNDDKTGKQKSGASAASAKGTSGMSPKTGDAAGVATLAFGILALIALCAATFAIVRRRANRE